MEKRSARLVSGGLTDEAGSRVLNMLKRLNDRRRTAKKDRISVVETGKNIGGDKCLCCFF